MKLKLDLDVDKFVLLNIAKTLEDWCHELYFRFQEYLEPEERNQMREDLIEIRKEIRRIKSKIETEREPGDG